MTTRRLLWGMTWRGGAWGLLSGMTLGGIYGMVVSFIVVELPDILSKQPQTIDALERLLRVDALLTLYSIVVGMGVGTPFGLALGLGGGLGMGLFTRILYFRPRERILYQRFQQSIGALAITFGISGYILLFYRIPNTEFFRFDFTLVFWMFMGFPAIIAGICGMFFSQRILRWYKNEMRTQPS